MLQGTLISMTGLPSIEVHEGTVVQIGRSSETKIKNLACSRTQIEVKLDTVNRLLMIKQVGQNNSGVNGKAIGHGMQVEVSDKVTIQLLLSDPLLVYRFDLVETQPIATWHSLPNRQVLAYVYGSVTKPKAGICAFDLDGTLINTASGKTFPINGNDWKFLYNNTIDKIRSHFSKNPTLGFVIITNQGWIEKCRTAERISQFQRKIELVIRRIGIPVLVLVLTGYDRFRKPSSEVWKLLVKEFNGGMIPNQKLSFYCGDAAGRQHDHSSVDRQFAENIGIRFCTPEEFFGSLDA